jgi:hypothetical protein
VPLTPLRLDFVRLRQCGEVADGPGNNEAVAVQIAFTLAGGSKDTRDVSRDGGLFGQHSGAGGEHELSVYNLARGSSETLLAMAGEIPLLKKLLFGARYGFWEITPVKAPPRHEPSRSVRTSSVRYH